MSNGQWREAFSIERIYMRWGFPHDAMIEWTHRKIDEPLLAVLAEPIVDASASHAHRRIRPHRWCQKPAAFCSIQRLPFRNFVHSVRARAAVMLYLRVPGIQCFRHNSATIKMEVEKNVLNIWHDVAIVRGENIMCQLISDSIQE